MGIMDVFNGLMGGGQSSSTTSPAPSGAGNPGNIPTNTGNPAPPTGNTAPNGVLPPNADASDSIKPEVESTPLDQFADLWKNEPTDPNAPLKQNGVFGNVDPKKFMEAAGKIDFAKVVTPDQMKAITAGGEDAVKAFASAMNSVAQSVYAQSSFATTKIVDAALAKAKNTFMADLPQHIKRSQVGDTLRSENPVFNNPAVLPIISALEQQLTVKYPSATATEITGMAKQYIEALGSSFTPKKQEQETNSSKKKDVDWGDYFGM